MLIFSLIFGLVLGLLAGGHLTNLASVRLRLIGLLFAGLAIRYATQWAIEHGIDLASTFRLPLFAGGFLLILVGLWANREHAGIPLAFVGVLLNAVAITTNAGYMPVWEPSVIAAGLPATEVGTAFHRIVGAGAATGIPGDFLAAAGPLGDIIPIPVPYLRNVASIGDLFLAAGLAFFLFATVVRAPGELAAAEAAKAAAAAAQMARRRGGPAGAGGGVAYATGAAVVGSGTVAYEPDGGLVSAQALERPVLLGGGSMGSEGTLRWTRLIPRPKVLERVRRHPYVRLALDSSFSALWTGQLISALGDRIHQVALAYVVFDATQSPLAVGAVFFTATLPNLLFGPIAGTLVDRWDHREVMIVSDLLRAGVVLLIPVAAVTNLALAYPLVFLVTTISIFFRPAKAAILPRMVAADDLVPANSALWVGETFSDIGGYFIAGLFVAFLGNQLPLAFWVDSVTYVASAMLIGSIVVAPLARAAGETAASAAGIAGQAAGAAAEAGRTALGRASAWLQALRADVREGWRFLRNDDVLYANTLQAIAAQFMLGIFLTLTPVFAAQSIQRGNVTDREAYAFLEGALGAGNLIGGFVVGLIGTRLALGRMVILGYVLTGLAVALLPLSGTLALALGVSFGIGVGNLVFVIPSQTLFQRRTPEGLMGRALGIRFSMVFGSMTVATAVGGLLGEWFGAAIVIGVFGLVTAAAGLAGLLVPAVRDA